MSRRPKTLCAADGDPSHATATIVIPSEPLGGANCGPGPVLPRPRERLRGPDAGREPASVAVACRAGRREVVSTRVLTKSIAPSMATPVAPRVPDADHAEAPTWRMQAREWRSLIEWTASRLSGDLIDQWPTGDGHPVLVLPGYLANGASTGYLRRTLRRLGYHTHDWGQGRNLGVRPGVETQVQERIRDLADKHGRPVSIVGWSLGGIIAREAARRTPEHVRQVITLGSPFRGDHTATRAWPVYAALNHRHRHLSPIDVAARTTRSEPLMVPTTCIYSRSDGIVAWECCTSLPAPRTENIEVDSTHLGFTHHLGTLYVIADRLAQPEGTWAPFQPAATL